jgi:integrase
LKKRRLGTATATFGTARVRKERAEKERFELVVADFIRLYAKPKNRRWDEAERILTSADLKAWQTRAIGSISRREVVQLVERVSERSPGAARLLFAHLRKLFNWSVGRLHLDQSPLNGLKGPELYKPRDRVLSDAEVALVWGASSKLPQSFGALIRMLLLTGQRREEVTAMRWSEIDLEKAEWIIPASRAKNGQSHSVDLSAPALSILEGLRPKSGTKASAKRTRRAVAASAKPKDLDLVFTTNGVTPVSGHSKAKAVLDEAIIALRMKESPAVAPDAAALPAWRIHDLRRTAATGMARLGFAPHVVEAVLNHRSGVRGGLVAVYQHYDHRPERRAALDAWARHVETLMQEK